MGLGRGEEDPNGSPGSGFFFFKCFKNKGIAALIGVVQSQGAGVKCWLGVSPAFAGVDF